MKIDAFDRLVKLKRPKSCIRGLATLAMLAWSGAAITAQPFADVHVHFNWDQREVIDAEQVAAKLQAANVEFAVAAGTPTELALELARASGGRVIPLFSPYIHELGRSDWHLSPRVVAMAEAGLSAGDYHGIGEIHFMVGFRPRFDNGVFLQLMALAVEYRVPVLIHIDSSNEEAFLAICGSSFPRATRGASAAWRAKTAACCPNGASW
jgi:Tat protein secretion system quality control protein TatD with DNase activity